MSPKSAPAPAVVTTPSDRVIRIERDFHAPRAKVWRAMSEPDLLVRWWGRGNPMDVERYEFEKGGHYRFVEHSDHGRHGFEGRFGDVNAPASMMQTFEWDGMPAHPARLVIELRDDGDTTHLVETLLFFTTEERDGMLQSGMEGGMNQSLAALDTVLSEL
jgi:uncharacterized protein YndB with AHSA1/START domain